MNSCILCLRSACAFNSYVPVSTRQGLEAVGMIEKHFWPIGNVQNKLGTCFSCWSKISEFNKFYETIKEAHRSDVHIFKMEKEARNFNVETSTEESNFTNGEPDEIKIEVDATEFEPILCVPTSMGNNNEKMALNSLTVEKRKRGRPRKIQTLIVKPKGKRGRPRKNISDKSVKHTDVNSFLKDVMVLHNTNPSKGDLINQTNYTTETVRQDRLPKKRRGRPPKIKQSNENNILKTVDELATPTDSVDSVKQCSKVQGEMLKDMPSDVNETENKAPKKLNLLRVMKKRKRLQQHKILMRNYIATSVRCMKFFKK